MKGLIRVFFVLSYIIFMLIVFGGTFKENMNKIKNTVERLQKTWEKLNKNINEINQEK